jgi:hypothetical protein
MTIHGFNCSGQGAPENCENMKTPQPEACESKKSRYKNKQYPWCQGDENFLEVFKDNIIRSDMGVDVLPDSVVEKRRAYWKQQESCSRLPGGKQQWEEDSTCGLGASREETQAAAGQEYEWTETDKKKYFDSLIDLYGTVDLYVPTSPSEGVEKK